jgi:acetyl esterase/lipase
MSFLPLLVLLLQPTSSTPVKDQPKYDSYPDVTYLEIDGVKMQLDLVVPKGDGPFPVVLCFHGGAWQAGNRKDLTKPALFNPGGHDGKHDFSVLENLAKNGYAAASVSYRLAPKHKFPAQIEDAKAAVKYLRKNAKVYKIDPDKMGAMGFSAGGHLAALLGVTRKEDGFEGKAMPEVSSEVQCVVDYFGPTDLTLYAESTEITKMLVPFLGKEAATDSNVMKKASPVTYIHKKAPPFLIIHGTVDLIVPYIHSEALKKKLKEVDVPCELLPVPWKGHGWEDPKAVELAAKATLKFLDANLKKKEEKK